MKDTFTNMEQNKTKMTLPVFSQKAWMELGKLGLVFILMGIGIIYLYDDLKQYKDQTDKRIADLELRLNDCNNDRIEDLKMFRSAYDYTPYPPADSDPYHQFNMQFAMLTPRKKSSNSTILVSE